MIRALLLVLALAASSSAMADEAKPDYGLIRNYTGLALVFPLQIKTRPGEDMLLALRDAETGELALTAMLEGGAFFRVLVPPGTFRLHIAAGRAWDEDAPPFGPSTRSFVYPEDLTFEIKGLSRKQGHLLDLRDRSETEASIIGLCQTLGYDPRDLNTLRDFYVLPFDDPDRPDTPPSREVRERFCT